MTAQKPPYRSKTNWMVNTPLFLLAILATLTEALKSPEISAVNPFSPGTMKWILFALAITGFYLRNFKTNKEITWKKHGNEDLTSGPPDVILNDNHGLQTPNEIPKIPGGGPDGPSA